MNRHTARFVRVFALAACALWLTVAAPSMRAQKGSDAQILRDAQGQLKGKKFSGVQVQVQGGVVQLTGQVDRFADKADAEKRVEKMHEAASIRNEIHVAGGAAVPDGELAQKLGKQLIYDREGYPSYPFNYITMQVHDGVVTLGGVVMNPVDKDSAMGIVANTAGVRDVVDHLHVAPVSPMDNRIREEEYRAIYGSPQFTKYAMNPLKPIRILVENGHVTLAGAVDSTSDRDQAGVRANAVPGVFSVANDLQVGGGSER